MKNILLVVNATPDYEPLFESALKESIIDIILKTDPENFNQELDSAIATKNHIILMKGLIETADFIRPILARNDLYTKGTLLSHCAILENDFGARFIVTDAAMNMYPNAETKVKIAENAIWLHKKLNDTIMLPKISALTPAGKLNPKIQSSVDAEFIAKELFGKAEVVPDQLDTAVSASAAATKGRVAARPADILLCHDLDSGNILYKAMTNFGGFSVGGLIIGTKLPICVNSRSDSKKSKLLALKYATRLR